MLSETAPAERDRLLLVPLRKGHSLGGTLSSENTNPNRTPSAPKRSGASPASQATSEPNSGSGLRYGSRSNGYGSGGNPLQTFVRIKALGALIEAPGPWHSSVPQKIFGTRSRPIERPHIGRRQTRWFPPDGGAIPVWLTTRAESPNPLKARHSGTGREPPIRRLVVNPSLSWLTLLRSFPSAKQTG